MGESDHISTVPIGQPIVRSRFHQPPAEFDGCFTTFYQLELEVPDGSTLRDSLLPEWANIRFFCGALPNARMGTTRIEGVRFAATGPSSLPCEFELGTSRMWGVGFLPLGWARFVDADAAQLTNVVCDGSRHPAFAKFDGLGEKLCDPEASTDEQLAALTEMLRQMMRPNRDEPKIVRINDALVSGSFTAVGDLADACGTSIRTLERLCARYFGFSPKLLMRRQRFMRSLTGFLLHKGTRWTEVMDSEYHDQAQFTREFHEFMTINPSEYAARDHPIIASFMEARARVWGSAAQTLDRPKR